MDLLSEDSAHSFMSKVNCQPLRTIIHRLIDSQQSDVDEAIAIVQFLTSYAKQARGSLHLYAEGIVSQLQKNKCVAQINHKFFYT